MSVAPSLPLLGGSALLLVLAAATNASAPAATAASELQGQRVFIRCASCHAIAANAPAKIGPNLRGVIGRRAGTQPDYGYSSAMKGASLTWDEAALDRWLTRPSSVVPGTSMAFAGLTKPEDRKAVIAYIRKASR